MSGEPSNLGNVLWGVCCGTAAGLSTLLFLVSSSSSRRAKALSKAHNIPSFREAHKLFDYPEYSGGVQDDFASRDLATPLVILQGDIATDVEPLGSDYNYRAEGVFRNTTISRLYYDNLYQPRKHEPIFSQAYQRPFYLLDSSGSNIRVVSDAVVFKDVPILYQRVFPKNVDDTFFPYPGKTVSVELTEQFISVGQRIWAVGELVSNVDGTLLLQRPTDPAHNEAPFIISCEPLTKSELVHDADSTASAYWWAGAIFGSLGLWAGYILFRRLQAKRRAQQRRQMRDQRDYMNNNRRN